MILLKLILQIRLSERGFISVSADEFARGIRAARWATQPQVNILTDVQATWLPLEKYLNGTLLLIWPNVMLVPRITVFIASCLVLIALFVLVYYLFDNFIIAALAALFVVFQPWYIWLSGTPMLEMYYLACFFGGVLFLLPWLKEEPCGRWVWAGLCFMLATGFHVQSWTFINVVNLFTIPYLYHYARHKQMTRFWQLVGFYLLGNSLILSFALIEFISSGKLFAFLARHTAYSRWFYGGYNVSVIEKLAYYPNLITGNVSKIVWLLVLLALIFLWRQRGSPGKWFPVLLGIATITVNSILNLFSGPPSAAPGRYSLWYVLLLSPYVAYGTYQLAVIGQRWENRIIKHVPTMLAMGLFLIPIWWGAVQSDNFPRGMSADAVATGQYLKELLDQDVPDKERRFMVELHYWDYLAIQLTAGHYEAIVYDREADRFNRNTPSMFAAATQPICLDLQAQKVQYVALRDPELQAISQQLGCLANLKEIGEWKVYRFIATP
ncbi:MAG: hypothetical protein KJ063_03735 [Anaerolineae bacterium]|nr:hypothetical protein [Anaerolineae bacterium]